MARAKSIRPKKQTPDQPLEQMMRTLGRPADGLLAAALEGVTPEQVMAEAEAPDATQLLRDGSTIILHAHKAWKAISLEQRIQLGGFSTNLLGLTASEFIRLQGLEAGYLEFLRAIEEAQTEVRRVFQRNLLVVDQAKRLFAKVAKHNEHVREELEAEEQPHTTFELAQLVERLVIVGGSLLRSQEVAQLSRAALYGLDDRYLDALGKVGAELMEAEEFIPSSLTCSAKKLAVERQRGVVVWLLRQIVEAFEGAHRFEAGIPMVYARPSGPVSGRTLALRAPQKAPSQGVPVARTQVYLAPQRGTAVIRPTPPPTQVLPLKLERVTK